MGTRDRKGLDSAGNTGAPFSYLGMTSFFYFSRTTASTGSSSTPIVRSEVCMALRNFCMDGTSSFASGTVVAQMIDPSCSILVIVAVFCSTSAPHLPFVCLSVCIQSTSHRREILHNNNNACTTRRKCLREIGIPQGIYSSTSEAL